MPSTKRIELEKVTKAMLAVHRKQPLPDLNTSFGDLLDAADEAAAACQRQRLKALKPILARSTQLLVQLGDLKQVNNADARVQDVRDGAAEALKLDAGFSHAMGDYYDGLPVSLAYAVGVGKDVVQAHLTRRLRVAQLDKQASELLGNIQALVTKAEYQAQRVKAQVAAERQKAEDMARKVAKGFLAELGTQGSALAMTRYKGEAHLDKLKEQLAARDYTGVQHSAAAAMCKTLADALGGVDAPLRHAQTKLQRLITIDKQLPGVLEDELDTARKHIQSIQEGQAKLTVLLKAFETELNKGEQRLQSKGPAKAKARA